MKKNKFQLGHILSISFAHMAHDTFSSFLAPLLPFLIEKLGISYAIAGLLSAIQKSPALLNPVIGIFADKINLRYFVIIAPAVTAISMSLLGVAPNVAVLMLILFFTGISSTVFHVPSPVMIKQVSGSKTGLGMSFYMLGGELARTIGPLLILGAVSLWGLEGSYKLIPIGLVASLILFFRIRNINISDKFQKIREKEKPHQTLKKLIPFFLFIGGYSFFRAIMKVSLTLFLPLYIKSKGGNIWFGGIALSLLQFAGAIGTLISGHYSDKIGRKNTLLLISFAMPVIMLIFSYTDGLLMIPALFLLGFFSFASGPVLLAFVQDTNSDNPAFLNSIYMALTFFISSIVTLGIGLFADYFGLIWTYKFCALLGFGLIPFALLMPSKVS